MKTCIHIIVLQIISNTLVLHFRGGMRMHIATSLNLKKNLEIKDFMQHTSALLLKNSFFVIAHTLIFQIALDGIYIHIRFSIMEVQKI